MKISRIKIENFKSLVKIDTPAFSEVNFIHGYNNSGKSNFLKFIELLFKSKSFNAPEEYEDEFGRRRYRMKEVTKTPFWSGVIYDSPFIFTNNDRNRKILFDVQMDLEKDEFPHSDELEAAGYLYIDRPNVEHPITPIHIIGEIVSLNQNDSQIFLNEVVLKGFKIYSNDAGAEKYFEEPANSPMLDKEAIFNDIMDVFNNCVMLIESERYFSNELLLNDPPQSYSISNFKNWLYGMSLDADKFEKYIDLINFLNKFNVTSSVKRVLDKNLVNFPFKDTKMTFSKFKEEIEVMLENPNGRFPLKNFGTGVQQILFILSRIFSTNARIVLIEELELNLSPEYQELIINNLLNFLKDRKIDQSFFTSHSDYLYRNDIKVFEVSIDEKGKSEIKTSTYDGLKSIHRSLLKFAEKK